MCKIKAYILLKFKGNYCLKHRPTKDFIKKEYFITDIV